MSLSGNLTLTLSFNEALYNPALATALETISRKIQEGASAIELADGTGANQVQKIFCLRETLTATTRTLDLTNLTTTTGGTVTTTSFSKIKLLYATNDNTTEGQYLLFGGAGSNTWCPMWSATTVKEKLMPLGSPMLKTNLGAQSSNPWTVDSTNKNLLIDAGAWTIPYRLVLIGV